MNKSIIIIGGGIAGLAAGCYGQMNGYRTQIFEMHNLPGGLCTAWERKGYVFDGCIHYLFGSGVGQPFHRLWEELGVDNRPFVNHEELTRVADPAGNRLIAYCDPDRLRAQMRLLAPEDAARIDRFCAGISKLTSFDMSLMQQKPRELMGMNDWSVIGPKLISFAEPMARWSLVSARNFAKSFKSPLLQKMVPHMFAWPDVPVFVGMSLLASMHTGNAGFPVGASLEFVRAIEQCYLELGGEIHYKAPVEKILVSESASGKKRATGVRLYDDSIHTADIVISAADGRSTIFDMLGGEFVDTKLKHNYDGHLPLHSQFQVSLGVDHDFSQEPHWVTYLLDQPLTIAGEDRFEIGVKHYCFDPSLAPPGKSVLIAMLTSHYGYWQRIYGKRLYDTEQTQVSDIVIDFLERLYPGLRAKIEVVDEATPLSYERFTGNWQGSSTGWLLTPKTMPMMITGMQKTLPGLENFYMAGQWVEPGGGVPMVAMSGRNVIQLICHEDRRDFVASKDVRVQKASC
ncbi:MAG: NAD(P)/FAD-dependent oxidoreductase [Caldilineaceae bacterium]